MFKEKGTDHPLVGKRIRMIQMSPDPHPIESGEMGTIKFVDDMGYIGVHWDNGRQLSVLPKEDEYKILE